MVLSKLNLTPNPQYLLQVQSTVWSNLTEFDTKPSISTPCTEYCIVLSKLNLTPNPQYLRDIQSYNPAQTGFDVSTLTSSAQPGQKSTPSQTTRLCLGISSGAWSWTSLSRGAHQASNQYCLIVIVDTV